MADPENPNPADDFTRTSADAPRDLNVPVDKLGDFELIREVGRGGMGVVYEARQISPNRRVALKVLPPELGLTKQAVTRFEREARAAAKLHHPLPELPRAMVLWNLGRQGEARSAYDEAAAWMTRSGCAAPELLRLQHEAAELIGRPGPDAG